MTMDARAEIEARADEPSETRNVRPGAGASDRASATSLEAPEYLPISYLNALVYCPRRFFYEYAQGEMLINEHVLQGRIHHQRSDAGGARISEGVFIMRRVYVYSDRLRLSGLIDVVEAPLASSSETSGDHEQAAREGAGSEPTAEAPDMEMAAAPGERSLYPVEYKKGSARGGGLNDHVQLCAQGLCLEERLGRELAGGYVFSFGTMHRTWIPFTRELRAQTGAIIERAFALLRAGVLPPPLPAEQDRKCRACSLEPLCLPREVRALGGVAEHSNFQ